MDKRAEIEMLISQVAMRDRAGFDALYAKTSAKLFGVILRIVKDRASAQTALQEVYVKIWHNADRFALGGYAPMTWLITIARNHAIDRLRASPETEDEVQAAVQIAVAAPDHSDTTPDRAAIVACLRVLEGDRANAVRGAYLNGDSYHDLAEHFGVPEHTMRSWMRSSVLKLRECLTQ